MSECLADFVVIGAGIVGLTIARELKLRYTGARIVVLEKESAPGLHSSSRNSGVLHSGIYYPSDSLKARVCGQGAKEMAEYHDAHGLPLVRRGKVLVATRADDGGQMDLLKQRAEHNGIAAEEVDEHGLRELEPEARSAIGRALWIPTTSVGSPKSVIGMLVDELERYGVRLLCNAAVRGIDVERRRIVLRDDSHVGYGHAVNTAGLFADRVAHMFGVGDEYALLPFKGIYWRLAPDSGLDIRHLIYPVPDLRVPFLGVHTTTSVDGITYLGPTAVPALGRENYRGLDNVSFSQAARIGAMLVRQLVQGKDGFRRLAWQEGRRYLKYWFADAARAIIPRLQASHLRACDKVGIRAQMVNQRTGSLVTDFLVKSGPHSTHILNAISPAWTSAFPFARYVCDEFIDRS